MIKRFIILLALMISATVGVVKPVQSQALMIDIAALEVACTSDPVLCESLIATMLAQLKALGLDPAALNQQIGVLAVALINIATTVTDSDLLSSIGDGLVVVAAESSDPDQEALIVEVASVVEGGGAGTLDTTDPILYASPS